MLRLAAYARVSTEEQDTIEAQLAACRDYAVHNGGAIVATETDKISGLDPRRPGYQRVLDLARRGEVDAIVVWKLSRFGRDHGESIRAALELERMGVQVLSTTEPTDSPLFRDLMLLLANNDSRVISQNVRLGMRAAAAKGRWLTTPPPGYRLVRDADGRNPHLVPDEKAPLVKRLFEIAATGGYSVRRLRDEANAIGLTSGTGRILSRTHVHKLLTNPAYVGDVVYGRRPHGRFQAKRVTTPDTWVVCRDAHPAIIDRETFEQVQTAFRQHKRFQAGVRGSAFLLTGLIRCGHCGSRMYGSPGGRGNFSYACTRGQGYGDCVIKSAGGKGIDAYVRSEISRIVITPDLRRSAEQIVRVQEKERQVEGEAQRRNLLASRRAIEEERINLARQLLGERGKLIASDVYQRLEQEKVDALRIIDRTLATLEEEKPLDLRAEMEFLEGVNWDEFDDEAWREAASVLIEEVSVRKGNAKGKPIVQIKWTPVASVIIEALAMQSV